VQETTLLGGYPNGGVLRNPGAHETIIDGSGGPPYDASTVICANNAKIDGVTITGGKGKGDASHGSVAGGGIYCHEKSPVISNNIIVGNSISAFWRHRRPGLSD
jgi:hypothetical protein